MPALVSVVIPTYNYAHFLDRAITSVLSQTYEPIECIVVDDGSTDHTPEVLTAFEDRVRVIRKSNGGLSSARNTGIEASRGDFVAFLDADDWWEPKKIGVQMQLLEHDPNVAAIGCSYREIGPSGRVLRTMLGGQFTARPEDNLRAVAQRALWLGGSGSGVVIRKSVLTEVGGFDTTLTAAEDWDMWLRLAAHYPLANTSDVLLSIHMHGTGSFRNAAKMEDNQWRVYAQAVERWPRLLGPAVRRRMRALILSDAGAEYSLAGNDSMAARRYLGALVNSPLNALVWKRLASVLRRKFVRPRVLATVRSNGLP